MLVESARPILEVATGPAFAHADGVQQSTANTFQRSFGFLRAGAGDDRGQLRASIGTLSASATYTLGRRKFGAIVGDHVQLGCGTVTEPGCLLAPHTTRYDDQQMACVSTDYYAQWASTVRDEQLKYMQTLLDKQPSYFRLMVSSERVSFWFPPMPWPPTPSFRFAGACGLTVLGEGLAKFLTQKEVFMHMTSADDVVSSSAIQLLRNICAPLMLHLINPSALMLSMILGMDICSHLEIDEMPACTPMLLHHVACTVNLRVLSLGYMTGGIPEPLRSACLQNTSLCYAGAYTSSRPLICSNGLIPHPSCWGPFLFTTSIVDYCPQPELQRLCDRLHDMYPDVHWEERQMNMTMYASTMLCCTPTHANSLFVRHHDRKWTTAFHGTSLARAVSIKQSMELQGGSYVTPQPYYALHPTYAVPYYFDEKHAIQALVEVDTSGRDFVKKPSSFNYCPLREKETIEWRCDSPLSVLAIYLLVYTRE